MVNTVAVQMLGSKCVEWYSCIVTRDIEHAVELKLEIDNLITGSEDESILTYYELVNYRHSLLMEDVQKRLKVAKEEILELDQSDVLLKYMFYFFSGQDEFYKGHYKRAIKNYIESAKIIEKIESNIEKAELYHRMGVAYYRLNQYGVAMSYMENSKEIFMLNECQKEKVLNCDLILGCIYSELNNFNMADKVFLKAIDNSKEFLITNALLLRTYGLNLIRQYKLDEAELYLKRALENDEHKNSYIGLKTQSELASVLLRLRKFEEGSLLLEEAEERSRNSSNEEYMIRNAIARKMYIDDDYKKVSELINELVELGYYFEVFEVSEEISKYFKDTGNFEESLKFSELALRMHIKQFEVGE